MSLQIWSHWTVFHSRMLMYDPKIWSCKSPIPRCLEVFLVLVNLWGTRPACYDVFLERFCRDFRMLFCLERGFWIGKGIYCKKSQNISRFCALKFILMKKMEFWNRWKSKKLEFSTWILAAKISTILGIFGAKIQIISVFPHFSPFYPQFDSFHPQSFFGGYISNLVEVEARILFIPLIRRARDQVH